MLYFVASCGSAVGSVFISGTYCNLDKFVAARCSLTFRKFGVALHCQIPFLQIGLRDSANIFVVVSAILFLLFSFYTVCLCVFGCV